ncbi:MAG: flagellar biosynthetic protein FliR [Pseudomonadota bacterium]
MLEILSLLLAVAQTWVETAALVFARVGSAVALMPGFGSQLLPRRLRLAVALSFTAILVPLVGGDLAPPEAFLPALMAEVSVGVILGLSLRLLVMALQFAGSIAAQSGAVAHVMAAGAMPDPMPALGNILVLAAITLALTLGLHLKIAEALALSYDAAPLGRLPRADLLADWIVARGAHAVGLGLTLSAPFVLGAFVYNLALGAINKAMPQLMVAFVGAPVISGGTLLMLLLASPLLLTVWVKQVDALLAAPLAVP